jgi:heme/copper-type cytochrome/quinol oxidase subunit 1
MNNILSKIYLHFFLFALILLIFNFRKPKETFDINIHDTYYVIQNSHLGILLFIIYLILGIIHLYIQKSEIPINNWIIYFHLITSIGGIMLIWFLIKKLSYSPQNIEEIVKSIKTKQYLIYACISTILIFILTQLLFIITVIFKTFRS